MLTVSGRSSPLLSVGESLLCDIRHEAELSKHWLYAPTRRDRSRKEVVDRTGNPV